MVLGIILLQMSNNYKTMLSLNSEAQGLIVINITNQKTLGMKFRNNL